MFFSIYTISKYSALWMKYPRKWHRYAEWYLIDIILNVIGGVFLCIFFTVCIYSGLDENR